MARRAGHDAAEIYRDLAPAVLGYFRSHRMQDPDGLTGDVFVAVAEGVRDFRGNDAALRRWVFTIAHHRRVDEIRRAVKRRDEPVASVGEELADTVELPEEVDPNLLGAMASLTDDQREVVVLRYVADLAVKDVAALTGRSKGSVKMLQQRALDALAARLTAGPEGNLENSSPSA